MLSTFSVPAQPSGWPVIGHDRAVDLLRRSLRTGKLSHAYLFTGPLGVGKRTLALTFAMALNCGSFGGDSSDFPDVPCLLCPSCSRVAHGTHPDVSEVNLQSQAAALGEGGGQGQVGPF
jgi:DNA polymerase-3 subunit delta'